MNRLLLMNLRDEDVDVLTRVRRMRPAPDIHVCHSDPEALIVRLARMARIPTHLDPPDPADADVVVVPEPELKSGAVGPWRDRGFRILSAAGFPPESWRSGDEDADASAEDASAENASPEDDPARAEPVALDALEAAAPHAAPPPDVLASPEASFRYLVESVLGEGNDAALWWDGGEDMWVPWVTVGDVPDPEIVPAGGFDVRTEWGEFRLDGDGVESAAFPRAAVKRVAEDLALRDLAAWRKRAAALARVPAVTVDSDPDVLETWWDFIAGVLDPATAMLWREDPDGWSLAAARGKGVAFTGLFHLDEDLLTATFPTGRGAWRRWEPVPGLRVYLRFADGDGRWPLRLKRVQTAVAERDAAR